MNTFGRLTLMVLAAVAVAACASSHRAFVGAGEPHATLVTSKPVHHQPSMYYFFAEDMGQRGTLISKNLNPGDYIYPVSLVAINGKNVVSDQLSYYVRPGEHEIVLSAVVRLDTGLATSIDHWQEKRGHMEINVEPGKRYYLGAKYNRQESGRSKDWQPVIWKVEDSKS